MALGAHHSVESKLVVHKNKIMHPSTNSMYEVLSSEAKTKHGPNLSALIFDEVHTQMSRDLWDTLEPAGAARKQYLLMAMSTAGEFRASLGYDVYKYAKRVRDGDVKDKELLPVIYEADPKNDDWEDEAVWRRVNPGLGSIVQMSFLRKQYRKAKEIPSMQPSFKRLHLNMWSESVSVWMDMKNWDPCYGTTRPPEPGDICYGGLDLSSVRDMTAWVLIFPQHCDDGQKRLRIHARLWVPEARLTDSENQYRNQYRAWKEAGLLSTVPGEVMEYDAIEDAIKADANAYFLESANLDRNFQGHEIMLRLQGAGINIFPFAQTFVALNSPMKELDRMIGKRALDHQDNPLLRWQAQNVAIAMDSNENIRPVKDKSSGRIDGIVALLGAIDRYIRREGGEGEEEHGLGVMVG